MNGETVSLNEGQKQHALCMIKHWNRYLNAPYRYLYRVLRPNTCTSGKSHLPIPVFTRYTGIWG